MTEEQISPQELDALNKDLEQANKTLVSEEVQKKIDAAKQEARAEAAKDAEVQSKLKELEAEKAALIKQKEEQEKKAAEELAKLKEKVDSVISSKAVISGQNPFNGEKKGELLSEKEADLIEKASFEALLNKRENINN